MRLLIVCIRDFQRQLLKRGISNIRGIDRQCRTDAMMRPVLIRYAVLLPLILCAFADGVCSAQIIGRWRSLEPSKGGIGAMYEFHANGAVDFSPGAVVEMPWRIENDQLIVPSDTVGGPEQKETIKWLGDNKVHFASGDASGFELTRIGQRSDAADTIIGEWVGTRQTDGRKMEMRWFFYPAGKSLLLIAFLTQHGLYAITNSTLHIAMPGAKPTDSKFQVKGDVLTLSKPEGRGESRFARY